MVWDIPRIATRGLSFQRGPPGYRSLDSRFNRGVIIVRSAYLLGRASSHARQHAVLG